MWVKRGSESGSVKRELLMVGVSGYTVLLAMEFLQRNVHFVS